MKSTTCKLAAAALALFAGQQASAALITFETPVDIASTATVDPDPAIHGQFVNNEGQTVIALNLTDLDETATVQNVTINGVDFSEIDTNDGTGEGNPAVATAVASAPYVTGSEMVTIDGDGSFRDDANSLGGIGPNFPSGGDVFELLVSAFILVDTISFEGLTEGDDYLVQIFAHDGRGSSVPDLITFTEDAVGGDSATLDSNQSAVGELELQIGESVIGRFTADATGSVTINVTSNADNIVSAVQLRNVTPVIPEPASSALLALGVVGCVARRRV